MNTYTIALLAKIMIIIYAASALISIVLYKRQKLCNVLSNLLSSTAAVIGIWLTTSNILSGTGKITIGNISLNVPHLELNLFLDKLSSFFILALSILVLSVSIYSISYIGHYNNKKNIGLFNLLYNIFILSMIIVMMSGNTICFLISWEIMALVSYFLVIFEDEYRETRKAGTIYLVMTNIGTAFLIIAFMLMYKYTHSFDIGVNMAAISGNIKNVIFILLLIGFGTKAGIIPLHVWLPYAHPAAPSNVSALMSGIMIKTAIYGIIRFGLIAFDSKPVWWGVVILSVGAVSAVLGVAYAFMEHNIKRLLAYSSIENIGIILIGLGISFIAYSTSNKALCALSLMAALLHLLNHTLFKGALFLGAGSIHYACHTKDIEDLGGLIKKMPYTGFFFLIASLSISAIPPFNGFIGEWVTYQSLFMSINSNTPGTSIVAMLSTGALAMAGAMAAACFVKVMGISFLGLPRSKHAECASEVPLTMRLGMGILAVLCTVIGIFPQLVLKLIDMVNVELWGNGIMSQMKGTSAFIYYPVTFNSNSISPAMVLVTGSILACTVLIIVKVVSQHSNERLYGTWDCGFTGLNSRMQYSATGFSKPLGIVLRMLIKPARELKVEQGSSPYYHKSMKYVVSTESLFEKYFYIPVVKTFTRFTRKARLIIQTGSVHAYLIYMFAAVIALLLYYSLS